MMHNRQCDGCVMMCTVTMSASVLLFASERAPRLFQFRCVCAIIMNNDESKMKCLKINTLLSQNWLVSELYFCSCCSEVKVCLMVSLVIATIVTLTVSITLIFMFKKPLAQTGALCCSTLKKVLVSYLRQQRKLISIQSTNTFCCSCIRHSDSRVLTSPDHREYLHFKHSQVKNFISRDVYTIILIIILVQTNIYE